MAALLQSALPNEPPATAGVLASAADGCRLTCGGNLGTQPAMGRQDIARLTAAVTNSRSQRGEKRNSGTALADTTQTRTWGLLIDEIAQTGKYARDATSVDRANKFVVEGEQHYWVHVAIDRFTNQIIDRQVEVVNE